MSKYNRLVIWLLSGILLCLSACSFGGKDAGSSPSASHTGKNSSQSITDTSADSYRTILLDNTAFINCSEDGEQLNAVNIGSIEKAFTSSEDITGEVTGFAIVDMDKDGENEMVLRISTGSIDEGFEILHCQGGMVYGYHFVYRALEELKEDGTFMGSGGASSSSVNQIVFLETGYAVDTLYESQSSYGADGVYEIQYYENGEACSEEDFQNALNRQYEKAGVTWYELTPENVALALENGVAE